MKNISKAHWILFSMLFLSTSLIATEPAQDSLMHTLLSAYEQYLDENPKACERMLQTALQDSVYLQGLSAYDQARFHFLYARSRISAYRQTLGNSNVQDAEVSSTLANQRSDIVDAFRKAFKLLNCTSEPFSSANPQIALFARPMKPLEKMVFDKAIDSGHDLCEESSQSIFGVPINKWTVSLAAATIGGLAGWQLDNR